MLLVTDYIQTDIGPSFPLFFFFSPFILFRIVGKCGEQGMYDGYGMRIASYKCLDDCLAVAASIEFWMDGTSTFCT